MRTEEIYHEGEEGARRRELEAYIHSFVFLASRRSPLCAFVVNIPVPGRFAYPVIECKQDTSRLLGLKNRIYGGKKCTTRARKAHERRGIEGVFSFLHVPGGPQNRA
ncbi:MAG: hypothetical protein LBH51_01725, partial [Treponema sp.]|nr:hypothetical protein [Treponema sp.]